MYVGRHVKYPLFLSDIYIMELEFSRQIFEKYSNTKFHENSSSGSRVVSCGRADRRDEANSRFSKFCERAKEQTTRHHISEDGNHELSSLVDEFSAFILDGAYYTASYPRRP